MENETSSVFKRVGRGRNKEYTSVNVKFNTLKEAENYITVQGLWHYVYSSQCKRFYKCNRCNMRIQIELKWRSEWVSTDFYYDISISEGEHIHPVSTHRGIESKARKEIIGLYNSGITMPSHIQFELEKKQIFVPRLKLYSFLNGLKRHRMNERLAEE